MATTAVKPGLSAKAYAEARKAADNAEALAEYQASLAESEKDLSQAQALIRVAREMVVNFRGAPGADHFAQAVSEMTNYTIPGLKRTVTDTKSRIARLTGETPAEDDEDE